MAIALSIIVVNWNSGPLLGRCLRSVHEALHLSMDGDYELIVVDNGSTDDSLSRAGLGRLMAGTQVLRNASNTGFGAACNQAARVARGEHILLLNPDCELRGGSVERCLAELRRADMRVGLCGVGLVDEAGRIARTCHRFPGFGELLAGAVGLNAVLPGLADSRMLDFDHASDRTVDHVMGAFYLLRTATWRALGGFDERFFVYLEDLDLSLRIQRAGYLARFVAAPVSMHIGGGTSRQVKAERLFYATRSRLLYAFKHLPAWQAWLHALATLLLEPLARSVQAVVVRRSWSEVRFTWRGFGLLYRSLPGLWPAVSRAAA